jgi:GNAT superfamily N-acetyltransferase
MITLRLATADDAEPLVKLFRASRALLTFLPELHTEEEDLGFVRNVLLPTHRVTVAELDGRLAGFMAEEDGWINQLYLDPGVLRSGIGSALIADAKARNDSIMLWCFAENHRARSFYEKHGFVAVEATDGSTNEARRPDVRYVWKP